MQSKECFNQKQAREFLADVCVSDEITQIINIVKLLGYCNAQNLNGRIFVVRKGSRYSITKGMPQIEQM